MSPEDINERRSEVELLVGHYQWLADNSGPERALLRDVAGRPAGSPPLLLAFQTRLNATSGFSLEIAQMLMEGLTGGGRYTRCPAEEFDVRLSLLERWFLQQIVSAVECLLKDCATGGAEKRVGWDDGSTFDMVMKAVNAENEALVKAGMPPLLDPARVNFVRGVYRLRSALLHSDGVSSKAIQIQIPTGGNIHARAGETVTARVCQVTMAAREFVSAMHPVITAALNRSLELTDEECA